MASVKMLLVFLWGVLHSFLYGFHITVLNGIQDAVICQADNGDIPSRFGLRGCLDLTDAQFGVIVSVLTLGGLAGSLSADFCTRKLGRIGTLRAGEIGIILGTAAVGLANSLWLMAAGRAIIGFASGLILVSVPLHLNEVSHHRYSTLVGSLHQIFIGTGMLVSQSLSLVFAEPLKWRFSLASGGGLAVLILIGGLFMKGGDAKAGTSADNEDSEETPLVAQSERKEPLSVKGLFTDSDKTIRRGLLVVIVVMFSQQFSGISPVMFFSTRILKTVFQAQSRLVALGMMAIGIPFNFVPGLLPESIGTRRLLLVSAAGTSLFSLLLAFGLNMNQQALSLVGTIGFVLSFSMGLAPLPWAVLSEVLPSEARTAGGSIGVGVNWGTNFLMGVFFLPLQRALQNGDAGEGNIFFFTAATGATAFIGIWLSYQLYHNAQREVEE